MKKLITLLLFFTIQITLAAYRDSLKINYQHYFKNQLTLMEDECDACSSSGSGGSMGFGSMLNTNFIGIRYFNQQYKSTDGMYSNSPWYDENYNTVQLWSIIPIVKKIQVLVQIPFQFHNRNTAQGYQEIDGLGDVNVMAMYKILSTKKDSTLFKHSLKLGAGMKFPTGSYSQTNVGSTNPSFQLGTGSWDYSFLTEYILKRKQFGVNMMLNYVLKTENDEYYRFGNQCNYAGTFFYLYQDDNLSFVPQIGFAGEVYGSNYKYSQLERFTKGDILFGKLGVEIGKDKFSFGVSAMLPIEQNLASGRVEAISRWSMNLNYSL